MYGLVDGNNFFVSCERVIDPKLEGKAVAVLSNNDGCCVSRSNEFKALGIPMGTPYFQLKDREAKGEVIFRSSNYELYGDISRRVIAVLRDEALEVEQYSIDEAFIVPPMRAAGNGEQGMGNGKEWLYEYGKRLRAKVLKWTGIPCGVGFAPTKTLAKIANHIAKKRPEGVFVMPDDPAEILSSLPVEEVWGIGRRMGERLRMRGIITALQLRDLSDSIIRSIGSVVTVRTATELRGIEAVVDKDYDADLDSVSCSRSFGTPVENLDGLAESVASFASQAAEKMRRHKMVAEGCNIYAQFGTACESRWVERSAIFDSPTNATNEILKAITKVIGALYIPGVKYRKSGVVFFGLTKEDSPRQMDLFDTPKATSPKVKELFKAVDALNRHYGRGMVFSASEGIKREWKMKRSLLSKRATTCWDDLMVVK
jgi:DNA polymerase V